MKAIGVNNVSKNLKAPKRGLTRWLKYVGLTAIVVGLAGGAVGLYNLRRDQNTRKLLDLAGEAEVAGRWDEAVIAYRQYLQRQPDDRRALEAYANALLISIETTPDVIGDAVRTLRRLVALEPSNADAIKKLTTLYLALAEYDLARDLAKNWVSLEPNSSDAAISLAVSQHRLDKPADASATLIAAIGRNPRVPKLYSLLVRTLSIDLDELEAAEQWLEKALLIAPNEFEIQLAAFTLHDRQGDSIAAENDLRRAIDLAPDSLATLLPAATYFLADGRIDDAENLLQRAQTVAPQSRAVLSLRVQWAIRTGRTRILLETANELMDRAADADSWLVAKAAELFLRAGELQRTDECIARLETLSQRKQTFSSRLDVLRGALALKKGNAYAALGYLQHVLRSEPSDGWAVRLAAHALAKIGDLDAAVDMYQRLVRIAPRDAGVRLRFAELAWQKNRFAEAREAVRTLTRAGGREEYQAELIGLACELRSGDRADRSLEHRSQLLERIDRLASETPRDAASIRWLLRCLVLAGKPDVAVDLLENRPPDARFAVALHAELGLLLLSEGHVDRALTLADRLTHAFPDATEGHVLHVRGLSGKGRLSEAATYAARIDLPRHIRGAVQEALADEYLAAGRTEEALALLRQVADLLPMNVSPRRRLVRWTPDLDEASRRSDEIRLLEGDSGLLWKFELAGASLRLDTSSRSVSRSRDLLKQCLADRPRWPAARVALGYADELSGMYREAVEYYRTAIAQKPDLRSGPLAIRLIGLLKQLGRFAEADVLLTSLVSTFPEAPDVLRLVLQRYIDRKDFDSALVTADQLVRLQPDQPEWAVTRADIQLLRGNAVQAEAFAREALLRLPDSTTVLRSLARSLVAQDRGEEAEAVIRQSISRTGEAAQYVLLAHVLAKLDRQSEAHDAIAAAQRLGSDDVNIWVASADFWAAQRQRDRKIICMRKAIELQGRDAETSIVLARMLASQGSAEELIEAGRIVQRRLQLNPDDSDCLVLDAKLALAGQPADKTRAIVSLRRALAINFRSAEAHRLLASLQRHGGEGDLAVETITTGLMFVPDDAGLLLDAAEIYSHRGEYDLAIRPLRRLLEIQPRMLPALRLLAVAYRKTGQTDRAIELIESLAPIDSLSQSETLILARLYEADSQFDRAETLFLKGLRSDEASTEALREVLSFFARRRDFQSVYSYATQHRADFPDDVASLAVAGHILGGQDAEVSLRDAGMEWLLAIADQHPDYAAEALFRCGMCYYERGLLDKALSSFLEARRRDPIAPKLINTLAWLYAFDMNRPDQARRTIDRFLEAGGRADPSLMDTHGAVLLRLGMFDAARQELEKCLRFVGQTPTRTAANYRLGSVLRQSGRVREAAPYFYTALRLVGRLGGLTGQEEENARRWASETGETRAEGRE